MSLTSRELFENLEKNIKQNILSIKDLVKEAESLKDMLDGLQDEQKLVIENHIASITEIIEALTKQTIEMLTTFRKIVE